MALYIETKNIFGGNYVAASFNLCVLKERLAIFYTQKV